MFIDIIVAISSNVWAFIYDQALTKIRRSKKEGRYKSKRGDRKGLMRDVSWIDGETRWKEERPLGMRMNFSRGKCKCCNNQQKSLPRRNAIKIKITFKPSTLLALSAITAPERPAPTENQRRVKHCFQL